MNARGSRLNRALALVLSTLFFTAAAIAAEGRLKAGVFEPPRPAPDFSLRGSDGTELTLSRYRGKIVVLAFGFTHCPGVCPTTLSMLAKARKKMGAIGNEVQVVYVTVDPERDSAERMRQYLAAFDASFIGGTGSSAELAQVRKAYGIVAERKPIGGSSGDYAVDHSSFLYLVDREGALRALVPYARGADDIAHDVKILLKK
jgi:protein SCO1/2